MEIPEPLYEFQRGDDSLVADLSVLASKRSAHAISRFITGKFCEHLGENINNGALAQILRNPTFADEPFFNGSMSPDGRTLLVSDLDEIARRIRDRAARWGWPDAASERAGTDYFDGLATCWIREGEKDRVRVSPDVAPNGDRAQRIEIQGPGEGVAQYSALPLHRIRRYEFRIMARSVGVSSASVSLYSRDGSAPLAQSAIEGLGDEWKTFEGKLEVPESAPADGIYRFVIAGESAGQIILRSAFLLPADHVGGCDPDVIRFLKESKLPLLRWPGGNFVSGYRWEDGIGPVDERPTRPNPAWGGVEPNLYGTDEFIAYCREIGCEPMICINGGDGTPEEAARWIEYCNGSEKTPMGALRAKNGHPKPYGVKHWEVGNELWGTWQVRWTTAQGYVDRYRRFSRAMLAADPSIRLYACGAPVLWGAAWNETIIAGIAPDLPATTDHPLVGGSVTADVEPLDVFRDFMGVPSVLERRWGDLRDSMKKAAVSEPELAVTELQLFPHIVPAKEGSETRLTYDHLTTPGTHSEAIYDLLIYHAAIRLAPFVRLITHSATVNHGGGLRKERERVYANPCHYAQSAFAAFAEATPVALKLRAATAKMPVVLGELRNAKEGGEYPVLDALAAIAKNGDLLLSLVHRETTGPLRLTVSLEGFSAASEAKTESFAAPFPWSLNTLSEPEAVRPISSVTSIRDGRLSLELPPWSAMILRIPSR